MELKESRTDQYTCNGLEGTQGARAVNCSEEVGQRIGWVPVCKMIDL